MFDPSKDVKIGSQLDITWHKVDVIHVRIVAEYMADTIWAMLDNNSIRSCFWNTCHALNGTECYVNEMCIAYGCYSSKEDICMIFQEGLRWTDSLCTRKAKILTGHVYSSDFSLVNHVFPLFLLPQWMRMTVIQIPATMGNVQMLSMASPVTVILVI